MIEKFLMQKLKTYYERKMLFALVLCSWLFSQISLSPYISIGNPSGRTHGLYENGILKSEIFSLSHLAWWKQRRA